MSTPYIFRNSKRPAWEDYFQRYAASGNSTDRDLRNYLKYGKWLGYWLEFLFQAYTGYTDNMIMAVGVPDDPASFPHSDPRRKL
ncbi:MAG TPA: hypothetical protein PK256_25275 [Verrucomicrobiota bacterium]|nr:hypothetical protein [Verrucomicrobiota bacterium]